MNDTTVGITKKDIHKFQTLYKKSFGIDLGNDVATRKLHMLLRQMQRVYRPVTAKQVKQLNAYGDENEQGKLDGRK